MSNYDNASFQGYSGLGPERFDMEYMTRYNIGANARADEERVRAESATYRSDASVEWIPGWSGQGSPATGSAGGGGDGAGLTIVLLVGGIVFVVVLLWKVLLALALVGVALLSVLYGYDVVVMRRGWRHPEVAGRDALIDLRHGAAAVPGRARRFADQLGQLARSVWRASGGRGRARIRQWGMRAAEAAARVRHALVVFDSRPRRVSGAISQLIEDCGAKLLLRSRLVALESLLTIAKCAFGK